MKAIKIILFAAICIAAGYLIKNYDLLAQAIEGFKSLIIK